jgi:hypothetical protein
MGCDGEEGKEIVYVDARPEWCGNGWVIRRGWKGTGWEGREIWVRGVEDNFLRSVFHRRRWAWCVSFYPTCCAVLGVFSGREYVGPKITRADLQTAFFFFFFFFVVVVVVIIILTLVITILSRFKGWRRTDELSTALENDPNPTPALPNSTRPTSFPFRSINPRIAPLEDVRP